MDLCDRTGHPRSLAARKASATNPCDTRYPCQFGWPPVTPVTLYPGLTLANIPDPSPVASRENSTIPARCGPSIRKCLRILKSGCAQSDEVEESLRQDSENRTKSNYLRDSWKWCIRGVSREIQEKRSKSVYRFLSELRALRYCGSRAGLAGGEETRETAERERMFVTLNPRTTWHRATYFRDALTILGMHPERANCHEREYRNEMTKHDYKPDVIEVST